MSTVEYEGDVAEAAFSHSPMMDLEEELEE